MIGILVKTVTAELSTDNNYMYVEIDGFSNMEIVKQIGVGELLADMEFNEIVKHIDLADFLNEVDSIEEVKEYLRQNGETEL